MKTTVVPNFISTAEQAALVAWACSSDLLVRNQPDYLLLSVQNKGRASTSGKRKSEFIHDDGPREFYEIQNRIVDHFGLQDRMPDGRQGKCIIHDTDSETPPHIDFYRHLGPGFTRATLLAQKPDEGGELYVGGRLVDLPERGLAIYDASTVHAVSLVTSGSRVAYVYGWRDALDLTSDIALGLRERERIQGEQLEARKRAELLERTDRDV